MRYIDSVGNEIKTGDIIRMYHFTSYYKRRKEYQYKQIGKPYNNVAGKEIGLKVHHLPIEKNSMNMLSKGFFIANNKDFKNCVVVSTVYDADTNNRNLKRNKKLRD